MYRPLRARVVACPAQRSHKTGATPSSLTASSAPHFKQLGMTVQDNSPGLIHGERLQRERHSGRSDIWGDRPCFDKKPATQRNGASGGQSGQAYEHSTSGQESTNFSVISFAPCWRLLDLCRSSTGMVRRPYLCSNWFFRSPDLSSFVSQASNRIQVSRQICGVVAKD